jgi:hypothetical protein
MIIRFNNTRKLEKNKSHWTRPKRFIERIHKNWRIWRFIAVGRDNREFFFFKFMNKLKSVRDINWLKLGFVFISIKISSEKFLMKVLCELNKRWSSWRLKNANSRDRSFFFLFQNIGQYRSRVQSMEWSTAEDQLLFLNNNNFFFLNKTHRN